MKKISVLTLIAVTFLFCGCSSPNSAPGSATAPSTTTSTTDPATPASESQSSAISILNFAFNPDMIIVKKDTTVTWTNNDTAPHQIKSDTFNSGMLGKGESFSHTFGSAGTFDYSCAIHPSMTGKVIVN